MGKFQDLTGYKYGKLTVLYRDTKNTSDGKPKWICLCECGKQKSVSGALLKRGEVKSCGCAISDYHARRNNAGAKKHRLYNLYTSIKSRCYNKNDIHYKYYGARGIRLYNEWEKDFWEFANYLESLPNYGVENYSIDRIDVNGDYAPGNIRWANAKQQANNRRKQTCVTAFGKTKTVSEWANETNINYYTLWSRIFKEHWSIGEALTLAIGEKRSKPLNI